MNRYEEQRQLTIRSFVVRRSDGQFDHVWAHYFENDNPTGALNFAFIEQGGRKTLRKGFAGGTWTEFWENPEMKAPKERKIQ
jgi:hypothetical protein